MQGNFFCWPVPPGNTEKFCNNLQRETQSYLHGWIASDYGVRRHIANDNRPCRNDCAIPNSNAGHDQGFISNPHIIADNGVAFKWQFAGLRHDFLPSITKNLEWIS